MRLLRGFTLIELLVVISIIAILTGVGMAVFGDIQKKGRDSRRKEDMLAVQKAFEQYFDANAVYPTTIGGASRFYSNGPVPVDPKNTGTYIYSCTANGSSCPGATYTLCADLETSTTNYCVGNLQQ